MRSMKNSITPERHVAKIRMLYNKNKKNCFLLVEGTNDKKFFNKFINASTCMILPLNGKEEVIEVLKKCHDCKEITDYVLGIVDCDYDKILNKLPTLKNLFFTDTHDVETMILKGGVFSNFQAEYGDPEAAQKAEEKWDKTILEHILQTAYKIGLIRLCDAKNKFCIGFENGSLEDDFDTNMNFDLEHWVARMLKGSGQKNEADAVMQVLMQAVSGAAPNTYDTWMLCNGHDITALINVYYCSEKSSLGNHNTRHLHIEQIESGLRLSYSPQMFMQTNLYDSFVAWQKQNVGYTLLQEDIFYENQKYEKVC